MIVFSNAKINLGLRIKEKRPDGYHNIETVFYPVPLHDIIEFVVSEQDEIIETGFKTNCHFSDNLILKALSLLRSFFGIPFFRVHLHKQIPVGAGLGGAIFQSLSGLAVKNISATSGYSAAYNLVFLGYGLLALIGLIIVLFVMGPLVKDEKLQRISEETSN